MVPPDSQQIPRARCYSGNAQEDATPSPTGLSPSTGAHSRTLRLTRRFLTPRPASSPDKDAPTTPHTQPLPGITCAWFSLLRFRSPLLTESRLFSLPAGTEMFHFPAFPPHTLYIQMRVTPHDGGRVTPFGHPRITARLTAPRGLSQPPTSFIGSWYQGIHRMPLPTYPQHTRRSQITRCSRPLCTSQRTTQENTPTPHPTTPHTARPSAPRARSLKTQQRTAPPPHPTHQGHSSSRQHPHNTRGQKTPQHKTLKNNNP